MCLLPLDQVTYNNKSVSQYLELWTTEKVRMSLNHWGRTPTLRGSFVMLRPTVMADIHDLALAHDDPDTMKFFPYGIESEPPTRESVENAMRSGRQVLTQIDVASGRIVGTTSMYNMDETHRRVTVGYTWISAVVRGTVINLESKLLLLDYIFGTLGATRAEFAADDLNVRSRRAILALGATEEGHLRKHARRRDGSWRTTVVFSVTDDDWPAVRANIESRISQRCATGEYKEPVFRADVVATELGPKLK